MTNGGSQSTKSDQGTSFVRWQGVFREQLGSTVNLVLTLAAAALAFGMDLLFQKDMVPLGASVHNVATAALGVLAVSIGLGVAVNISRLSDFRWTARRGRVRALKRAYLAGRFPRLSPWIATLPGYEELGQAITALQRVAGQIDKLPKETTQIGGVDVAVPLVSRAELGLHDEAEAIRKILPDKFEALRDYCRAKADACSDTTWLLFPTQLIVFVAGILLLAGALAFQSYQR